MDREFDKTKMKYFDENHEGEIIKDMARGMSMNEVCNFFGCEFDDLKPDSEDLEFFQYWYRMGRQAGNRQAVQALFKQMEQRGGGAIAISYLARFSEDWIAEVEADGETKGNKSFRVILD